MSTDDLVRISTPEDIERATGVLERAFEADPLMPYLLPDVPATERAKRAHWYYAANVRHAVLFGEAYATPGYEGVAAWLGPKQDNWAYEKLQQSGMARMEEEFGPAARKRFMRLVSLPMPQTPQPYWYLLILGVDPAYQRQGIGRRLLTPLLARAEAAGETIRLETNNPNSLPFYRRLGFEIIYKGWVGTAIRQWALVRRTY